MIQEEKELLLKDLCARLPYGVKVHIEHDVFYDERYPYNCTLSARTIDEFTHNAKLEVKPYLRPMSSMTEEEFNELSNIDAKRGIFSSRHLTLHLDGEVIDYLNKRMLDWRGIIYKGLAIEAPEEMYNIK